MDRFRYSDEIIDAFPSVRGGVIHAVGLVNRPTPQDLLDAYLAEQEAVLRSLGDTPLSELPAIAAWRRAFTAFGVKPTQYRSAIEALLRRLTKQGDIPSINSLVDTANLVSIRHRLPVAVFDQRGVSGGTTVRFASGHERFTNLGSESVTNPEPGEVVFVDDAGTVCARRWCWRQSDQSAATSATTQALITVEGLHEGAATDVEAAVGDLLALLAEQHPTTRLVSVVLSPERRVFTS
jgi:DNA/RNA-binding domain of Phe-tRNA-synthetase-like protein